MLEVTDKDFKAAIVTMLKYIKENMLIMNEKIRNISRNRNYVFKWNSKTENIISVTKNTWTYNQNGDDRKPSVNLKIDL